MKILITGTPGVGKTTFSLEISRRFNIQHVEMSEYIRQNKLYTEFDERFKTFIFDEDVVRSSIEDHLRETDSYIIDSHDCRAVRGLRFDLVLVMTAPIEVLYRRLRDRGYDEIKIKENIECEIFGVVKEEAEVVFGMNVQVVGKEDDGITPDDAMVLIEKRIGAEKV